MTRWDDEHPGAGDTGCVADVATRLGQVAESCTDTVTVLDAARATVPEAVWSGQAADAWRGALAAPRRDFEAVVAQIEAVRPALTTWTDAVASIADRATAARDVRDAARSRVHQLAGFLGDGAAEQYRRRLQEDAEAEIWQAQQALEALASERQEADDTLVAALRPPSSPRWTATRNALEAVGVTGVDGLTPAALAAAFAEVARRVADQGEVPDPDDVAALQDFLDAFGGDRSTMAQFFRAVGGTDTVGLVDRLGDAVVAEDVDPDIALALAVALRAGLSLASEGWTPRAAQEFADQMLDGASSTGEGRVSAIGFLFSDEVRQPLGEELTVAVADALDEQERASAWRGPWVDTSPMAGGRTLAFLEGETRGWEGTRADDVAGRVFSTLGTYPLAALEWLSGEAPDPIDGTKELGEQRILYWYGDRDWSARTTGDGFEGPAALWAGAQQVPGGPADASGYAPEAWQKVATVTTGVVQGLAENTTFLPENLSELGTTRLAEGVASSVPHLAEQPVYELDTRVSPDDPFVDDYLPGETEVRAIPNVDKPQLAMLLAAATSTEAGLHRLDGAVTGYQDALVEAVVSGGLPAEGVLDRVAALQGLLDGADEGGSLGSASRHDDTAQQGLDLVTMVVDEIPIPAVGELVSEGLREVVDRLQDEAVGAAKDWGTEQATSAWGDTYAAELERQKGGTDDRYAAVEGALRTMVDQLGEAGRPMSAAQSDEYVQQLMSRYDDAYAHYSTDAEGRGDEG